MSETLPSQVADEDRPAEDLISTRVVRAVAAIDGVGPLDLAPLGNAIDTDALDRLVESVRDDREAPRTVLEFPYEGHVVRVTGDARVLVDPGTDHTDHTEPG